jgi:alpha-1,6-mannosyltransferase
VARALGLGSASQDARAWIGIAVMILAVAAFLWAAAEAWAGRISASTALWLGVAFSLATLLLPLLFSRDVYSYTFEGRISSIYHANPYVAVPSSFPHDPLIALVGPKWASTPSVYGPGFSSLSAGLTSVISGVNGMILTFKLIAVGACIATLFVVARLTERVAPERAAFAVLVIGWNPVVLLHSVASGHNDMLVCLAVACAIALMFSGYEAWAVAALTLGMLVKATAVFPLILLVVVAGVRRPKGERFATVAKLLGIAATIGLAFALPFLNTKDPTLGMANLATHTGWLAPSRMFHDGAIHIARDLGIPTIGRILGVFFKALFPLAFAAALLVIVRDLVRKGSDVTVAQQGAAWAWILLMFALCGPVLLPWYIVWGIALFWLLPEGPRHGTLWLSALFALSDVVSEPIRAPGIYNGALLVVHYVLTTAVFGVLVWLLVDLYRRIRDGMPLAAALAPSEPRDQIARQADS